MSVILYTVLGIIPLLYWYLTRNLDYWKKRGVPYFKPAPLFGTLWRLMSMKQSPGEFLGSLHSAPEALKERFMGMFLWNNEPALLIRDPELARHIYVKDFAYFRNRNAMTDPHNDPIGYNNIFVLRDERWKYLRSKLSPTFTSGRMKLMFRLIIDIADQLTRKIDTLCEGKPTIIELKEVAAKYTTDVISTCAFGIQSNSLNDPNATFREFGKKIFSMTFKRATEVRAFFFMHSIAKFLKAIFLQKESCAFFRNVFWEAINHREKENIVRHDFLDTLIELRRETRRKLAEDPNNKELFEFDGDELVAQAVLFFTAGFETTSNAITTTLIELSFNQEIQNRLREEIDTALAGNGGKLTYDLLFDMKYLDQVVSETLRKYPPMPIIDRICTQDYKIPDSEVVVRKGTPVFIGLYNGFHYDTNHWVDPQKYDPERFSEENKTTRHPFAYIPFGEGPHICIGMRFGLMNVKTSLAYLLHKYRFEPGPGLSLPLPIDKLAFLLTIEGEVNVKVIPLSPST